MTLRKGKKKEKNDGNNYGTTSQEEDLDAQIQRVSAPAHEADIVQEIVLVYMSETTEQAKPKANTWSKVAAKRSSVKYTTSSSARPSVKTCRWQTFRSPTHQKTSILPWRHCPRMLSGEY